MKKSNEIIKTASELFEHYLPLVAFIFLIFGGILIMNEAMEELNELQIESGIIGGSMFLLLGFSFLSFMCGLMVQENKHKIDSNDKDESQ